MGTFIPLKPVGASKMEYLQWFVSYVIWLAAEKLNVLNWPFSIYWTVNSRGVPTDNLVIHWILKCKLCQVIIFDHNEYKLTYVRWTRLTPN